MAHPAASGQRFVVGVDGSSEATAALRWALDAAEVHHAEAEAVHAFWLASDRELQLSAMIELRHEAEELLRSVVEPATAAHPGVRVTRRVAEGSPARVLLEAASDAALLVVGSRGRGGFTGLLLGSVSQQCVHHASCPVAVVRGAPRRDHPAGERPYTVVVGVDGSPASQRALRWAMADGRARHGRVRVIHAWLSPYDWQLETLYPVDEEKLRVAARERLEEAMAGVDPGDVAVEAELVEGDPRRVLVDAAGDADLLVVGSHGRGRIGELLLGSVSSFCVHHGPGPVVVVRGQREGPRRSAAV